MIFASQFVTLDGIATDPDVWHPDYTSEESNALLLEEVAAADTHLLGRKTYEELSGFWPSVPSDVPLADATNTLPKLAVSTTTQDLAWGDGVERSDIELAPTDVVQHLDQLPRAFVCARVEGRTKASMSFANAVCAVAELNGPTATRAASTAEISPGDSST